jgi:hypothetical protein
MALQELMAANHRWRPDTMQPIRKHPGEFMVESAENALPDRARQQIPAWVESVAAQSLGAGYGVTFGDLYAALRPGGGPVLTDGAVLGLATWATGYLGWLPALGLMPPVHRQEPAQVFGLVVHHVLYGVATVAAYQWLRERTG